MLTNLIKKFTILLLIGPVLSFAQLSERLEEMTNKENAIYKEYEPLLYEATQYVFSHPVNVQSEEFVSAIQIVVFWMNRVDELSIPAFGNFFMALTNDNKQQFMYVVAMTHYLLDQKIKNNRILTCKPVDGEKYSEQEDVKETQLGGAKILLKYMGDEKNNIPMSDATQKYYQAFLKNELETVFFK